MEKKVTYNLEEGIAVVTINNPPMNALSTPAKADLEAVFDELSRKGGDVRGVIITGAGEKAFAVGADIKELLEINPDSARARLQQSYEMNRKIERFPRPVISAINGLCLGLGLEVAMCCDIRIATERSRFGQPEVNIGIIPGAGGTQRLPRLIPAGIAKELIFTGRIIGAEEAKSIGLINYVVPPEELMTKAKEVASLVTEKPPLAVRAAKDAINRGIGMPLDSGLELERDLFCYLCGTQDQKEGVKAFLEKRKPVFKGI